MFINTPYLWGGRSVFGADCSGFVQTAFRYLDIHLPRDAAHQALKGETVSLLQEARCGDLAFFDDPEGDIIHVGILLNEASIIHSYGKVRVDAIDNEGIVNTETGNRTHRLRIIKRNF
jgi:cell wall-associated NlpC family hydrolase